MRKQKLEAPEENSFKKARTEEASVPSVRNSSAFDPTDTVELITPDQKHEEE